MLLIVSCTPKAIGPHIETEINNIQDLQLCVIWEERCCFKIENFILTKTKLPKHALVLRARVSLEYSEESKDIAIFSCDFMRLPSILLAV